MCAASGSSDDGREDRRVSESVIVSKERVTDLPSRTSELFKDRERRTRLAMREARDTSCGLHSGPGVWMNLWISGPIT